jgi:hypothetical protein
MNLCCTSLLHFALRLCQFLLSTLRLNHLQPQSKFVTLGRLTLLSVLVLGTYRFKVQTCTFKVQSATHFRVRGVSQMGVDLETMRLLSADESYFKNISQMRREAIKFLK